MEIRETPQLTPESVSFLEGLISRNSGLKVLEFGCGGSTIWFSRRLSFPNAWLVSVEHDSECYSAIKNIVCKDADLRLMQRPYSLVCDEFADESFDVVMVDGEDRVLCVAMAMRLVKPGGYIMLNNAEKSEYSAVEQILLSEWPFCRTTSCYEQARGGSKWFTDVWQKPNTKYSANVPDETLVGHGESFAHQRDFQQASIFGKLAIEKNTCVADALNLLAVVCCSKDETQNAIGLLEAGHALDPGHPNIGKNLAIMYANMDRRSEAIAVLKELLVIHSDDEDIISALESLGATDPVEQIQEPAVAIEQKLEATTEWLREMTLKINQACGDPDKLIEIASELTERGVDDTAEELARVVINQNPNHADAYNLLGAVYYARGQSHEALRYLENARRLAPDNTDIAKNLIGLYTQLGQYEQAIELSHVMLELCPSDPELPGIIEHLLETAMNSVKAAQAENNSTKEIEADDTSARMVTIYSDQNYLAKGQEHHTLLSPFWGAVESDSIDGALAGQSTRFHCAASEFFSMAPLENADVAVFPGNWKKGVKASAKKFAKEAADAGKPMLIFCNSNSDEEIAIDNSIVFRTSLYASKRKPNEYALPAFNVDFVELYLDSRVPLRRKTEKPKVSFCGCPTTDPTGTRKKAIKALKASKQVETSFVIRDNYWGDIKDESERKAARDEYVKNMINSDYVLCVRGAGNFSYRLYETLCCGRIPVFINTDTVLPYDDIIDWQSYGVWLDESELDSAAEKVAQFHNSLSADDYYELQFNCRKLWEQWLSPAGFYSNLWRYMPKPSAAINESTYTQGLDTVLVGQA